MTRHRKQFRCAGIIRANTRCTRTVAEEGGFCGLHENMDPKRFEARAAAAQRRLRAPVKVPQQWELLRSLMEDSEQPFDWEHFVRGLSPKELITGCLRDDDGKLLKGGTPRWVPRQFHAACMQELFRRGKEEYQGAYLTAIRYMTRLVQDPEADPRLRYDAAKYIWERVEGKVPDKVVVTNEADPWEAALIEATVTEEEMIERARRKLADQSAEG